MNHDLEYDNVWSGDLQRAERDTPNQIVWLVGSLRRKEGYKVDSQSLVFDDLAEQREGRDAKATVRTPEGGSLILNIEFKQRYQLYPDLLLEEQSYYDYDQRSQEGKRPCRWLPWTKKTATDILVYSWKEQFDLVHHRYNAQSLFKWFWANYSRFEVKWAKTTDENHEILYWTENRCVPLEEVVSFLVDRTYDPRPCFQTEKIEKAELRPQRQLDDYTKGE